MGARGQCSHTAWVEGVRVGAAGREGLAGTRAAPRSRAMQIHRSRSQAIRQRKLQPHGETFPGVGRGRGWYSEKVLQGQWKQGPASVPQAKQSGEHPTSNIRGRASLSPGGTALIVSLSLPLCSLWEDSGQPQGLREGQSGDSSTHIEMNVCPRKAIPNCQKLETCQVALRPPARIP